jgi:hypothetical protein
MLGQLCLCLAAAAAAEQELELSAAAAPDGSSNSPTLLLPRLLSLPACSTTKQHCAFPDCGQLDFLPFRCGCGQTFCLEHRTAAAHKCPVAADCKQVIVCPLCAQVRGVGLGCSCCAVGRPRACLAGVLPLM